LVTSAAELHSHLEAKHRGFVENIYKLFPQVQKRFAVHLEKVFTEYIIEPKTDNSPPRKTPAAITAPAATPEAGVKRKGPVDGPDAKKKAPVVAVKPPFKLMPFALRLPKELFNAEARLREQHFREKELVDKLTPSQLR
jgi:hypothetical protein